MEHVRYEVVTCVYDSQEGPPVTCYGIRAIVQQGDTENPFFLCADITTDLLKMHRFVSLLETNKVAAIHIYDIIEDMFWSA